MIEAISPRTSSAKRYVASSAAATKVTVPAFVPTVTATTGEVFDSAKRGLAMVKAAALAPIVAPVVKR